MDVQKSYRRDLQHLADNHSQRGLLLRFVRGRTRAFKLRNLVTVVGSLALSVLLDLWVGLATFVLASLGEAVDYVVLKKVQGRISAGAQLRRLTWLAALSGAFQALTISGCVLLAVLAGGAQDTTFFAFAFLAGAAMNAGLYLPFHRESALVRLAIYVATFFGLIIREFVVSQPFNNAAFNVISGAILASMIYALTQFVLGNYARVRRIEMDLIEQGTALAKTNAELQETQKEMRTLAMVAENAQDSIILSEPDGRIRWVNDAFTRITGYRLQDVVGRNPAEFLNGSQTDIAANQAILDAKAKGEAARVEICNLRKDGQKIWIDTNIVPIKGAGGKTELFIAIERDITNAKQHEKELEQARDQAKAGERAKSEFLAVMSHEIRTPMNAILGMADLLTQAGLPDEQSQQATVIEQSATALLEIVGDILDFSQLDSASHEIAAENFDVPDKIQAVVDRFVPQAAEKGLGLICNGLRDVPRTLSGDHSRLEKILNNVLGNAIKFTESGQVVVSVNSSSQGARHRLSLEVSDTGIGIRDKDIDEIFTQFSQTENSKARRFGGTGLGLAIARGFAELMGGGIRVRSKYGEGSVFSIQVLLDDPIEGKAAVEVTSRKPVNGGFKLLIAEDNATNRLLLSKYSAGLACDLRFAKNGQEAVVEADRFAPDLIFMDLSMPVMDGIEATTRIRALGHERGAVPIVALTANSLDSDKRKCFEVGMNGFLSKPIRKATFLAALAEWGDVGPSVGQANSGATSSRAQQ